MIRYARKYEQKTKVPNELLGCAACSDCAHSLKDTRAFNPFMPSGFFYLNSLNRSISSKRDVWLVFFIISMFNEIPIFNANNADPDQAPRSAASDLGCTVYQYLFYKTIGINGVKMYLV